MDNQKKCCKCGEIKTHNNFGKLKSTKDGLRYDCNECRKNYRKEKAIFIKEKQKEYYENNRILVNSKNKEYRIANSEKINVQRKNYRNRPEIQEYIKQKNKEYLPKKCEQIKLKRKSNKDFQLKELLRSKFHRVINGYNTSYINILNCDVSFLKKWLEFRFDNNMTWDNLGTYWEIDHILPISLFDATNDEHIKVCFHWTNLQPLEKKENRIKSNIIQLHYYFNNIVNVNRFNKSNKDFMGYQVLNESLKWLRNNSGMVKIPHMNNGQSASKPLNPI